jgi:hypothetical protein
VLVDIVGPRDSFGKGKGLSSNAMRRSGNIDGDVAATPVPWRKFLPCRRGFTPTIRRQRKRRAETCCTGMREMPRAQDALEWPTYSV